MLTRQSTVLALFAFVLSIAFGAMPSAGQSITATRKTTIVLPTDTIPSEQTAAKELQHYLSQITGSDCQIVTENPGAGLQGNVIYVGATQFAQVHLKDKKSFDDEEWAMQTAGNALILTGGRPRGTLYAAYHFLEDVGGVHWWTPYEETVPAKNVLSLANLNRREKPAFRYRDINFTRWRNKITIYDSNTGSFMARSRLNRQGDAYVSAAYGGSRSYYGPPYSVHTSYKSIYLDPKKYYPAHPDWFLGNGKEPPTTSNSQPAYSNPELRKEFLRLLLINIRETRASSSAKKWPVPNLYDVSQNDNNLSLVSGPEDEALVKENGGAESAILLSFINYLADGIKDEFPDVYMTTLAYLIGERAPTNMTVRDNVVIRLTDTSSNVLAPITAERNRGMHEKVQSWKKICKNLRIWDYAITYRFPHLPQPTMQTYPTDLQFLQRHQIDGEFIQFEKPTEADMRDMKIWILCKMLENPQQDYNALVKEFTNGYYGAAGPYVRHYLTRLETAATESGAFIHWFADLNAYIYLTTNFLLQADGIYAKAAAAVKSDPLLSRRVAVARASVDNAILQRFPLLMKEWQQTGKAENTFPLDRDAAGKRYVQAVNAQIDLWVADAEQQSERDTVQKTVSGLTSASIKTQATVQASIARIARTASAPLIDGKLDDVAWKQGTVIDDFSITSRKTSPKEATRVRLTYDARNLYASWRVQESLLGVTQQRSREVRISAKKQDDDVISDDSVALFLQPDENGKVLEFNVNSIGTLFDAQSSKNNLWGTRDASWNSGAQAAGMQHDGYWTAELAIPWKAFGLNSAPAEGATWILGLARHAAGRDEVSAWSQNDSPAIHEMTNFGKMEFGASVP